MPNQRKVLDSCHRVLVLLPPIGLSLRVDRENKALACLVILSEALR